MSSGYVLPLGFWPVCLRLISFLLVH
uniref:Uncharacterized protein n=1 Tax=Anguilla anguilla TaxID=7936 RepID=A0A0E9P9Q8_ANGAN